MQMKRWFVATAVLLLVGCGAKPPEDQVKALYSAIERGKQDEALHLIHPKVLQVLPESKIRASMTSMQDRFAKCGGLKDVQVALAPGATERKGKSTLTFKGDCKPQESTVFVGEIAGKWLVVL